MKPKKYHNHYQSKYFHDTIYISSTNEIRIHEEVGCSCNKITVNAAPYVVAIDLKWGLHDTDIKQVQELKFTPMKKMI